MNFPASIPDTSVTAVTEHNIFLVQKDDEHWKLRILPDMLELVGPVHSLRFSRSQATGVMNLNTGQMHGPTFSVRLRKGASDAGAPSKMLFRCREDAYEQLEYWFGYRNLVRMEFRTGWLNVALLCFFILVDEIHFIVAGPLPPPQILSFVGLVALAATHFFGWVKPMPSLWFLNMAGWALIAFIHLPGINPVPSWSSLLVIIIAGFSIRRSFVRYRRLKRIQKAA